MSRPVTAYISGPLQPDKGYFEAFYRRRIEDAIESGHHFVLCGASGIDTEALRFLSKHKALNLDRVKVYLHVREAPQLRPRLAWFESLGGQINVKGQNHTERDEECTKNSHYDILRYRTAEECRELYGKSYRPRVSGTEKNELRRKAGVGLDWLEGQPPRLKLEPPDVQA